MKSAWECEHPQEAQIPCFCDMDCYCRRPGGPCPSPPPLENASHRHLRVVPFTKEELGVLMRNAWILAVTTNVKNPPAAWLKPWSECGDQIKAIDRDMGEYIAKALGCKPSDDAEPEVPFREWEGTQGGADYVYRNQEQPRPVMDDGTVLPC